jgi:DNA ligase-1
MRNGFQLASVWIPKLKRDLSGWIWSEKLDGVRALWDSRRGLISRNNHAFKTPSSFTSSLPRKIFLDGELYIDRGMFHDTVSVVRTREVWTPLVKFKIFDVWSPATRNYGYLDRLDWFKQQNAYTLLSDHIHLINSFALDTGNADEITSLLGSVIQKGGEGLILRDPKGLYTEGRQSANKSGILKVKPSLDDEAEVVSVSLDEGRKGSVTVRDNEGRIFKIGSGFRDIKSEPPPQVGSVITFGYTSRHEDSGIPRFPRFLRIRSDSNI